MIGKLAIDPQHLKDAGDSLRKVKGDFEGLPQRTKDVSGFISDSALSNKISEFGTNWTKKREEMLNAIGGLGDAAHGIGDTIMDVDNKLKTELESGKSGTDSGNGGAH